MQAQDIMTRDVITIHPDATVHDVAQMLADYRISGVPVLDEHGVMVGLVTEADIISKEGATVAEIMSRQVMSVGAETPVDHIAQLLTSRGFKRVPVVREGALVGIVSRADIVRMMAARWVCTRCGATSRGAQPPACESCGAPASAIEHDMQSREQVSRRQ